jgi:hypothetical protein
LVWISSKIGVVIVAVHVNQIFKTQVLIKRVWTDMKNPGGTFIAPESSKSNWWCEREEMRCGDCTQLEHCHLLRCVPGNHDPGQICTPISDQVLANCETRRDIIKPVLRETEMGQMFIHRISGAFLFKENGTHSVFQYRRTLPVLT